MASTPPDPPGREVEPPAARRRRRSLRERVVRFRADPDLADHDVSARISAYVYGNIILFAALLPLTPHAAEHLHAVGVVVGASLTTFLAHLFAELVGRGAGSTGSDAHGWRHELRDSLPIATTAIVPCLVLLLSAVGVIPGRLALVVSDVYLLLRIASIGFVVERLRSRRQSLRGLLAGILLALAAALIALAKVALAH